MKTILAALAGACACVATASAQETGSLVNDQVAADPLARCMVENHDPSVEAPMKKLMIAVLGEGPIDEAAVTAQTNAFGLAILNSAAQNCGANIATLGDPGPQRSIQLYGGWVGEKIMTEAMGRLGGL